MSLTTSVVVPARNAARTLLATLESIAAQTSPPLEVLVVDDGSSDDTAALAHSMAGRLPNLRVLSIPHSGVSAARNAGIAQARGDLVAPFDADDVMHPSFLEKLAAPFARDPACGLAYCYLRDIGLDGTILRGGVVVPVSGPGFHRLLAVNYAPAGSVAVFRRRSIIEAGGYDAALLRSEDYVMLLTMAQRYPVAVVPEHLVGYRRVPGSLGKQPHIGTKDGTPLADYLPARFPDVPARYFNWLLARTRARLALRLARASNRAAAPRLLSAARHMAQALLTDPLGAGGVLADAALRSLRHERPDGQANWATGLPFESVDPARLDPRPLSWLVRRRLEIARRADEEAGANWTLSHAQDKPAQT